MWKLIQKELKLLIRQISSDSRQKRIKVGISLYRGSIQSSTLPNVMFFTNQHKFSECDIKIGSKVFLIFLLRCLVRYLQKKYRLINLKKEPQRQVLNFLQSFGVFFY